MSTKEQLKQAQKLIKANKFDEARDLLETLDHPVAEKWIKRIDELHPPLSIEKRKHDAVKPKRTSAIKSKLKQARYAIQAKEYERARDLLEGIDDPTAKRWLEKLEDIDMFATDSAKNTSTTQVIVNQGSNPGCLTQALWFIFIGWYVGAIWVSLAWLVMLSVIGVPLAIWMINRVPKVMALRSPSKKTIVTTSGTTTTVEVNASSRQHNILLRIIYFVLIGWWFSGIWMSFAYAIALTIIGLPLGFWMFDKTPGILTLQRS